MASPQQVALVTGASSGIGQATAELFKRLLPESALERVKRRVFSRK